MGCGAFIRGRVWGVYARSGLMPELLSVYHLFGDPATRIRAAR